jgi:hypothetical protein
VIVELSAHDVTRLTSGDDVLVGGVTVRLSMSLMGSAANGVESLPPAPPRAPDTIFRMIARHNGRCHECDGFIRAGGPIVRDSKLKRTLCMGCGEPALMAPHGQSATAA